MKLWLDDIRDPRDYGLLNWTWAKTADQAIEIFNNHEVTEASLDHDLSIEATMGQPKAGEDTGYTVVCWLENNPDHWPSGGVRVHSMNPSGSYKMRLVIQRHYGRIFDVNFGPPPKIARLYA